MPTTDLSLRSIEIYALDVPLKEPFVIATETIELAGNIAVKLITADGLAGWGECSPYRTITGETQASGLAVAPLLARALIGLPHTAIEEATQRMDKVIRGQNAIKSAFDLALYDLAARRAGLPLYAFLGGQNDRELVTDMTIGIGSPEKMAVAARHFQAEGFPTLKIKLGTTAEADITRLKAIREAIGADLPLRTDANQGWNLPTAQHVLSAMPDFGVEYCEQPLPYWDLEGLAELRRHSPVPIMADESLFDHRDALRILRMGASDAFNIKLTKSGGIANALRITAIAETAGMPCQVGCFSETRLAMSALAHFCLARPSVIYFDMDSPLMLAEDPVQGGITYLDNGRIRVPDTPGIGAELVLPELEPIVVK